MKVVHFRGDDQDYFLVGTNDAKMISGSLKEVAQSVSLRGEVCPSDAAFLDDLANILANPGKPELMMDFEECWDSEPDQLDYLEGRA